MDRRVKNSEIICLCPMFSLVVWPTIQQREHMLVNDDILGGLDL